MGKPDDRGVFVSGDYTLLSITKEAKEKIENGVCVWEHNSCKAVHYVDFMKTPPKSKKRTTPEPVEESLCSQDTELSFEVLLTPTAKMQKTTSLQSAVDLVNKTPLFMKEIAE